MNIIIAILIAALVGGAIGFLGGKIFEKVSNKVINKRLNNILEGKEKNTLKLSPIEKIDIKTFVTQDEDGNIIRKNLNDLK